MTPEIQTFFQEIGQVAVESAPDNWTSIQLIKRSLHTYSELDVLFYGTWGEQPKQTGLKDKHLPAGKRTTNKIDALRQVMYNQDPALGAWYTFTMTIDKEGNFDTKFDYDTLPKWDDQPVEEQYAEDFKQFPRKSDTIPAWLKPMLLKFNGKYGFNL